MRLAISREALGIVLTHLFDNAFRHEATGIAIAVHEVAGWSEIELRGDGIGISPANRMRIFEPFFTTRR